MTEILFTIVFPLVLLVLLIIILFSGIFKEKQTREFMTLDEFIKDWLKDHGQTQKAEEQFEKMRKDPAGKIYMPCFIDSTKRRNIINCMTYIRFMLTNDPINPIRNFLA